MLRHLHIRDFVIVPDVTIDFSPGLTVITGETGSGKSLLIDALGLLTGQRATPSLVRSGTDRATIEAIFDAPARQAFGRLLAEMGLEGDESGEVILRREIQSSGRSRCSVNGRLVPVGQLADVATRLIEICGQHDQQRLTEPAFQRDIYDMFAGLGDLRGRVDKAHRALLDAVHEMENLRNGERDRLQRMEFLAFQIDELESLELREGEIDELQAERHRLAHVEDLRSRGYTASVALADSDNGEPTAGDLVGSAASALEEMAEHDPSLQGILEAVLQCQELLNNAGFELRGYLDGLEGDPARLDEVEERLATLRRVFRKHGATEGEVLRRLEEMREERARLENWEQSCETITARVKQLRCALGREAHELTTAREKAKSRFLRPLSALLADFAMPNVRLAMAFTPVGNGVDIDDDRRCGPAGQEEVSILFSANKGEDMQPLGKIASGGELGRVMLALRTLGASRGEVPLLIFDEVDTGISGVAARRVAERLAALGERCQVLCVTHNAAVAAAAQNHLIVAKHESAGRTASTVAAAEGVRREEELARLLDGGKVSRKSRDLAAEMLEQAG